MYKCLCFLFKCAVDLIIPFQVWHLWVRVNRVRDNPSPPPAALVEAGGALFVEVGDVFTEVVVGLLDCPLPAYWSKVFSLYVYPVPLDGS